MADRKIQALTLIHRIRQYEMEEEAAGLAALNLQITELERQKAVLFDRLRSQAHGRTIEAAPYVGGFVRAVRSEEARLSAEIAALERQAAEQEAAVLERFREMKTYGKVLDTAIARAPRRPGPQRGSRNRRSDDPALGPDLAQAVSPLILHNTSYPPHLRPPAHPGSATPASCSSWKICSNASDGAVFWLLRCDSKAVAGPKKRTAASVSGSAPDR